VEQLERGVEIVEPMVRAHGSDAGPFIRLAGFAKGVRSLHGGYNASRPQPPTTVMIRLFQRIAGIWEDLAGRNPTVLGFQSDLSIFYFALQEMQASAGQSSEALASLGRALAVDEKLVRQDPKVPEYRARLARTHEAFTWRLRVRGPADEVESHFHQALKLSRELADECRDVPNYRFVLAVGHGNFGQWLAETGRQKEAQESYQQALIVQEKLVNEFPQMPAYRTTLAGIHESSGHCFRDAGKLEAAEKEYREALKNWDLLADQFPSNENYRVPYGAFCLCRLLGASHREEEADRIYRRILDFQPDTPDGLNYMAWALAARPHPRFYDPKKALELVTRAVQQAPDTAYMWNTLGLAHYRNGSWREAIEALEKSMRLGGEGDSMDKFLLAMAHWRLGDKDQARKWYNRAVQWMENNEQRALDEELRYDLVRFHEEAAQLLGIKGQPTTAETLKPNPRAPGR
jgi:tetratricopeptide (TPR) repeat protein